MKMHEIDLLECDFKKWQQVYILLKFDQPIYWIWDGSL